MLLNVNIHVVSDIACYVKHAHQQYISTCIMMNETKICTLGPEQSVKVFPITSQCFSHFKRCTLTF